jgi:NADP-dependent 3-hydroxy acid dehydrogenase YdfG
MGALTGKIAWVTGAGSGIGQAAAISLASEGATIVLSGRRREPLEETARRIEAFGGQTLVQPVDVGDSAQVTAAMAAVTWADSPKSTG